VFPPEHGGHKVSSAEFEQNMEAKLRDTQFSNDIGPPLAPGFEWDTARAAARMRSQFQTSDAGSFECCG